MIECFFLPFINHQFMLHALIAGVLVSITCAVVGTFVILRGMAFIGDAISHGVLPGIAAALLLGYPGVVGAAAGTVVMIGAISLITQKSRLSSDTAIGLSFVGMLSLGVVIVSRSTSFSGDLTRILFGEILGVSLASIMVQIVVAIIVIAAALVCNRPFLMLCFDPQQTQVAGFSVRLYHNVMLALIALTVIASFQTVGTLLVFGILLAPAGTGALIARRISTMMIWSAIFGVVSVFLGLLCSYYFNFAAGASIVLVSVFIFFVVFLIQNIRGQRIRRPELLPPHQ